MAGWATRAHARVGLLTDRAQQFKDEKPSDERLDRWLAELARQDKAIKGAHPVWDGLSGDGAEEAWEALHRIEEGIDEYEPLDRLVRLARTHIHKELPARRVSEIDRELGPGRAEQERRTAAVEAIREAHDAAEAKHASERNWQRGIVLISGAALLAGPVMVLVQAAYAERGSLVPPPSDGTSLPSAVLLGLVLFFGLLGGLLGTLVTQYRIYDKRQVVTTTLWFDPMPALTMAKMALGMWLAFVGVLLVGTELVVGVYTSLGALVLLAFLFGYAQQAVTKFMDQKVALMLEES